VALVFVQESLTGVPGLRRLNIRYANRAQHRQQTKQRSAFAAMDNTWVALQESRHHVLIYLVQAQLARLKPFAESGNRVQLNRRRHWRESLIFDLF
jgi:hypothetical protein